MAVLHLTYHGQPGLWTASFNRPHRFLWGNWELPPATAIHVESDGRSALFNIQCRGQRLKAHLTRRNGIWNGVGTPLAQFGRGENQISLMPITAVDKADLRDVYPLMVDAISPAMVRTCQKAVDLIADHAKVYLPWVLRLMRHVALLREERSIIRSGTLSRLFGFSHLSFSANPLAIAEMLVHEVSHHHLHLLARIGPLVDPRNRELYYSPVKRRKRSLERILLAYHAFANVFLFYRTCYSSGKVDPSYCARNLHELEEQLRTMDAALRSTRSLTELGRALYVPLASRLAH